MRSEYDYGRAQKQRDPSSTSNRGSHSSSEKSYQGGSTRSTTSDRSYQTLATEHSIDYFTSKRPHDHSYHASQQLDSAAKQSVDAPSQHRHPVVHQAPPSSNRQGRQQTHEQYFEDRSLRESPRSSVQSFTSTIADEEDFEARPREVDFPYDTEQVQEPASKVTAATPSDFSQLFPSSRSLLIHHDDTTDDGNMNLRIDTEVTVDGFPCDMTLFHLRLQDLKNREFSLRRYCRDSGREVCHTTRKQQKPSSAKRPGFSRSLSNALTHMRTPSGQNTPTLSRNDSGYSSVKSGGSVDDRWIPASSQIAQSQEQPLAENIRLEFSNYAQAVIKRVGTKGNKRYEFEYWNVLYSWRRVIQRDGDVKRVSYYLTGNGSDTKLAHITPVVLTASDAETERDKGGWIPPCRMRIVDKKILTAQKDLADVIVACGLIAVVDDAIRARLESSRDHSLLMPASISYIGPKRLIHEMFSRKENGSQPVSRPSSSRQSSRPSTSGSSYTTSGAMPEPVRWST